LEQETPKAEIPSPLKIPTKLTSQKLKTTTKIPKLDSILENAEAEQLEKSQLEEPEESYGEEPFTEENLRKIWGDFAESTKAAGRDSEYAVLKQEFRLQNKHTIIITFTNSVKMMILDKFRSDLIVHLKSTLNNRHIKLETELKEDNSTRVPYTNSEKFEFLAEKKPILKELQSRLGLDPDF
jgi:DNA polymerase-3 subunit gamma/tau